MSSIHDPTGHLSAWFSDPSLAQVIVGQHQATKTWNLRFLIPDRLVQKLSVGFALSDRRVLVHCDADAHL